MDSMIQFAGETLLPFLGRHWPWCAIAAGMTVIGQFTSLRLFTRERAYAPGRAKVLWWWGRETLSLHPLITGALIGYFAPYPYDSRWLSTTYYFAAGVVSLGLWTLIKASAKYAAKKHGFEIEITLPGHSERPR